jgi:predicted transcriptional regulator YheO
MALKGDKRKWSFAYSPDADYAGLLENSLPSFWNSRLSNIFATSVETLVSTLPKRMSLEEKRKKAKALHQSGLSFKKIAVVLNVSKSTAYNYVHDHS